MNELANVPQLNPNIPLIILPTATPTPLHLIIPPGLLSTIASSPTPTPTMTPTPTPKVVIVTATATPGSQSANTMGSPAASASPSIAVSPTPTPKTAMVAGSIQNVVTVGVIVVLAAIIMFQLLFPRRQKPQKPEQEKTE